MKAELTLPPELVDLIADTVIEKLKPLITGNGKQEDGIIFDVSGLAQYLKVKKQWVYERVHYNTVPHYKVGKYPRFRKSKIDEWLKKMEKGNGRKTHNTIRRLLEATGTKP